ncbi:Uncharacterized protein APZ42_000058, partial [Daphnia magna]
LALYIPLFSNSISFRGLNAVRQNMTTTPVRVQAWCKREVYQLFS